MKLLIIFLISFVVVFLVAGLLGVFVFLLTRKREEEEI